MALRFQRGQQFGVYATKSAVAHAQQMVAGPVCGFNLFDQLLNGVGNVRPVDHGCKSNGGFGGVHAKLLAALKA